MPLVRCQHIGCIHCDLKNNSKCKAHIITLGDNWDEGCNAYEDYRDQPDYQNEYWVAVKTKSGETGKVKHCGKRIEYKGRAFYTAHRLDDNFCRITDAETGLDCGAYVLLEDCFESICEQAAKFPKVETLPEAEWTRGGYELAKEDHHENG